MFGFTLLLVFIGLMAGYIALAVCLFRKCRQAGWGFVASTFTIWLTVVLTSHFASPVAMGLFVIVVPGAYVATAVFLFLHRRRAGWSFLGITTAICLIWYTNTNVVRHYDEQMKYRLVGQGEEITVELVTSRGDRFLTGSSELATKLRGRTNDTVQVSMTRTFDFGRMRSYEIRSVNGTDPYVP
ncbi:hypothetical protein [Pedosphaera parvula]|uniref:Uncharacterized protein n=1 Tax=Pedosphaera parvula (strain Ellin514) TaxID=320771 RepID=B9XE74_PEDPL|nr:hypothetical protein [Pedosphaera parvula]EEF61965.1 hypothetical protein Cflav_PD4628 [Pedosphaera parvula Ellin514]